MWVRKDVTGSSAYEISMQTDRKSGRDPSEATVKISDMKLVMHSRVLRVKKRI